MTIVRQSIIEEADAPKTFEQLAIIGADSSGSMGETIAETGRTKAQEVVHYLLAPDDGLLGRLRNSSTRDSFWASLLTFDHRVDVAIPPTPVAQISDQDIDIDLVAKHGQSTALGLYLRESEAVSQAWITMADPDIPRVVTILAESDGRETADSDPLGVADAIKRNAKDEPRLGRPSISIATCAFGDDADDGMLKAIASIGPDGSPMFMRAQSGEQMRDFFIRSITAARGTP